MVPALKRTNQTMKEGGVQGSRSAAKSAAQKPKTGRCLYSWQQGRQRRRSCCCATAPTAPMLLTPCLDPMLPLVFACPLQSSHCGKGSLILLTMVLSLQVQTSVLSVRLLCCWHSLVLAVCCAGPCKYRDPVGVLLHAFCRLSK